jgi:hypothetical protein
VQPTATKRDRGKENIDGQSISVRNVAQKLIEIPSELGLQDLQCEAIREDIRLMSDYIDCVALRNHNGKYGYDLYAMEYLNKRSGMDATICDEEAAKALDLKAGRLAMLLKNATRIRNSQLGRDTYSFD